MRMRFIGIAVIFALVATLGISVSAQAQDTCQDATGASIPCPPTQEPGGGGGGGDDSTKPTRVPPLPTFTATPLPPTATATVVLSLPPATPFNPTQAPKPIAFPEDDYLGTCDKASGDLQSCFDKFDDLCPDGTLVIKVNIYNGTYDFYCVEREQDGTLPVALPEEGGGTSGWGGLCEYGEGFESCLMDFHNQCDADGGILEEYDTVKDSTVAHCTFPDKEPARLDFPNVLTLPAEEETGNWTSGCFGDDVDDCVDNLAALCDQDGGDLSVWYDDEGGAGVHCENESEASGKSWEEECSWGFCWMHDLNCWIDGGSGYVVEDSVGNTGYHCDLPDDDDSSRPAPKNWLPWLGLGAVVVVGAILLPAVQKVREAAARQKG